MKLDYQTPRPLSELTKSERQGWVGFAIWIPAMAFVAMILGLLMEVMK